MKGKKGDLEEHKPEEGRGKKKENKPDISLRVQAGRVRGEKGDRKKKELLSEETKRGWCCHREQGTRNGVGGEGVEGENVWERE